MKSKLSLIEMANVVANEDAWENISNDITNEFNFEEIKFLVHKLGK